MIPIVIDTSKPMDADDLKHLLQKAYDEGYRDGYYQGITQSGWQPTISGIPYTIYKTNTGNPYEVRCNADK